MFISAVIDIPSSNVDQKYEYHVPSFLESFIEIGKRIKVDFNNKPILGFILDIYEESVYTKGEVKDILEVLDYQPILSKEQIELAFIIKDECICPLVRIFNLMIPKSLKLKSFKYIKIVNRMILSNEILNLFPKQDQIDFNKIPEDLIKEVRKEIEKGNLEIVKDAKEKRTIKYFKTYFVNKDEYYQNASTIRSYVKREALEQMLNEEPLTIDEIIDKYELTICQVRDLIKKGFLLVDKKEVSRIKERILNTNFKINKTFDLEDINNHLQENKPILFIPSNNLENENTLLGLTYQTLKEKKNVVIFCPEILSTYKYASIIKKELNVNVACINSNLLEPEYYDYYQSIVNNEFQVIVTSQKGILLPYQNVGLYYLLNEDSDNYYSDQSPRYDLHQLLILLSRINKSNVVMSSLAPSITSYCNGLKQIMTIVDHSKKDFVNNNLVIVNMIDELKEGNSSYISNKLSEEIKNVNEDINHNLLLILNNKNYSSHILCRDCGETPVCERCSISLKYHEKGGYLLCPSCGKHYEFNNECPKCHSKNIIFGGIGIESLNKQLDEIPNINQYHKMIIDDNNFELLNDIHTSLDENQNNIIITTESLSRSMPSGFFDNVTIINFDSSLKNPSFDASSKCYSMLNHCESLLNKNGHLIIQTTNPFHYVINSFVEHNYVNFVKKELEIRKAEKNVPFMRVNRIIVKAKYEEMFKIANTIKNTIISLHEKTVFVLGPTYSKKEMGAILIIKHNTNTINDIYKKIYELYQNTDATIIFDKHPRSL